MPKSVGVKVNPELLRWARERASMEIKTLSENKLLGNYQQIEKGEQLPTLRQIKAIANKTHVAVGELFLSKPPKEQIPPIPDFRTVGGNEMNRPSTELLDTIDLCLVRQDWYREFLIDEGHGRLGFVGSEDLRSSPKAVARKIRAALRLDTKERAGLGNWEKALNHFVSKAEDIGVLVMISSVYGNNTTRKLKADEFRGFALVDDHAPLVFINGSDAKAAQMFTLAHELAHVWLGKTGISNDSYDQKPMAGVEKWCNEVAAEVLVPAQELHGAASTANLEKDVAVEAKRLSMHFKVSLLVIIRRLHAEGFISKAKYKKAYLAEWNRFAKPKATGGKSGGDNFYKTLRNRAGERFSRALLSSALGGETLYRDAMHMLGIKKLSTFDECAKNLGLR